MPENENVAAESPVFRLPRLAAGEILALLAALLYLPSIWGRLLWDDGYLLFNNHASWSALGDIWAGRSSVDYFPLSQTLFWAEARLWNLDARGCHVINITLHAIAVVLLWQVLKRLSIPGAWLGALIFAVHPLCVESVAWIAEEKNTLSLALYSAALLAYLHFEKRPAVRRYALALGLFVLALLAKTAAVILPLVLLLFAWWQRGRITRQDLLRTLPFFAAALTLGLITVHFQTTTLETGVSTVDLALWDRIRQSGEYFWFYLCKAVFPYPLMTLYPSFVSLGVLPDLLAVAAAVALWINRRTAWGRALAFALAYYTLALAPALGFFKMSFWVYAPVADRFQYFALIGVTALAGAAIASAPWKLGIRTAAGATLCAILAAASVYQEGGYNSEVALWRRQLAWTPDSVRTLDLLGGALVLDKRPAEALEYLQEAAAISPNDPDVPGSLGAALLELGRAQEASVELEEAHRRVPDSTTVLNNLAMSYGLQRRLDEAAAVYRRVLGAQPQNAGAHEGLGRILADQGHLKQARREFELAVEIDPRRSAARQSLEAVIRRGGGD